MNTIANVPRMLRPIPVTLALTLCLLVAAGMASGQEETEVSGTADNPLTPLNEPHKASSLEGDFTVVWPSGCSKITTRTPLEDDGADALTDEYPISVFCDRFEEKGEGCSVIVIFNAKNPHGEEAGPPEVLDRMVQQLQNYGARIIEQKPLKRDFGEGIVAEGLDLRAAQNGGSGQIWLRGFLVGSDIYLMSAWGLGGGVWSNPEYVTFFNSFQLGAE